jgi:hypothetical protein
VTTLVVSFFLFGAVSLVLGLPLFLVARNTGRPDTVRRFAGGAAFVGLFCATLTFSSERLVNQCLATGSNPAYTCLDPGSAGLQALAIVGYGIVAWLTALALWRR